MTDSLKDLIAQKASIDAQIDKLKKVETGRVVADIHKMMSDYGITAFDLGFGKGKGSKAAAGPKGQIKYRSADGVKTWTGKGRKPNWILDAVAAGKSMESFAV